jgi:hypothetical protein|tara:strand:+ start:15947 stop:16204 length:258 start_codon:yes stop_codon:yes gene_type:complete
MCDNYEATGKTPAPGNEHESTNDSNTMELNTTRDTSCATPIEADNDRVEIRITGQGRHISLMLPRDIYNVFVASDETALVHIIQK